MNKINPHSFHIPVLGIGYSIDTPVKVAHLGISSVISLLDDMLIEKLRAFYSKKFDLPFQAISKKIDDFRAKRITAYLNMVNKIAHDKFEELKTTCDQKSSEFSKYIDLLQDSSALKQKFEQFKQDWDNLDLKDWIHENLSMGSIDVNIMTKVDKENYKDHVKLPAKYNDGHAALRGFVNSDLNSSVVLSAGMSPRLYNYLETFDDFYPDTNFTLKKKITLKVSDHRSALIQGKYLAKKGLWVSEYRIESGLNCGGHAFPTNGFLLGPVLEEINRNREDLIYQTFELLKVALKAKNRPCPENALEIKITAQGGVGTFEEHQFLTDQYQIDSVGWGTPFLLVPEVVNVDEQTLDLLCKAREEYLFISDISPLGVPFNNLKGNTKDKEKETYIHQNTPGNPCHKKYAALNNEFGEPTLCTASRKYQKLKIEELKASGLPDDEFQAEYRKIVNKSCICVGLGTSALLVNELDTSVEKKGVSICPGPNMAYFSEVMTLKEMVDHIYGKINIISRNDRPNMFIKELTIYIDYLRKKMNETSLPWTKKQQEYFADFRDNLCNGIQYYKELFSQVKTTLFDKKKKLISDLEVCELELKKLPLHQNEEVLA
ncbi:MAG TPA: hypothetical protein PKN44_08140 [Bacteroidales bacterium]|nr:hypothetical protein [Bacteroidales bacterium]HPS51659.1 hypothetical protein [Bacteroidales bacterium]